MNFYIISFFNVLIINNIVSDKSADKYKGIESNENLQDMNRDIDTPCIQEQRKNLVTPLRFERSVQNEKIDNSDGTDIKKNKLNHSLIDMNTTEEPCIGSPEFCNLTKEEYVTMLKEYIYPQTYEWVLIGTHTAVFVMGLVGNALVCIAVYKNHTMRTVTNYFIVNLAVADFMVILFCLPPTVLWDVTETWFLGNALCKILLYFQSVSVTVSVLTLTFISLDRWYAICFPLEFKSTTGRAKTAIFIIWTISLLFNTPELVVLATVKTVPLRFELEYLVQCMAIWSSTSDLVWHIVKVLFIYTIPLLLMTIAYYQIVKVLWRSDNIPGQAEKIKLASAEQKMFIPPSFVAMTIFKAVSLVISDDTHGKKGNDNILMSLPQGQLRSRRKAAKMLVAVVVMFAVCYFPVHLLSVLRYTLDMEQNDVITLIALISHVMCYANSAINPLIYNFMSGKYRREFRRAFCCTSKSVRDTLTVTTRTMSRNRKQGSIPILDLDRRQYACHTLAARNGYRNTYLS